METDLRQLHADVVKKKSGGKIIWQPRIGCWYDDRMAAGTPLPLRYQGLKPHEIYKDLGCSARPYLDYNNAFIRVDPQSVRRYKNKLNELETEHVIETPVGRLTEITRYVEKVPREQKIKWKICNEDDMKVAIWLEDNSEWRFDQKILNEVDEIWGSMCSPTIYLPRVNVQGLFINDMGVEEGVFAIYDYEDLVHEYFKALDRNHMRLIDVVNSSPVDIINFGDNVHCGIINDQMFEDYLLPAYHERVEKLHEAGKFVSAHWDGDTKNFLKYAKQTKLDGIEAITPKPQGDVVLEEVKEALGDMFLLDGVSALLFDPMYTEDELLSQAEEVIKLFAPNLILGISDEIASTGDIERVRLVGKLVDKYNSQQ